LEVILQYSVFFAGGEEGGLHFDLPGSMMVSAFSEDLAL
jgi:hypothetical protein